MKYRSSLVITAIAALISFAKVAPANASRSVAGIALGGGTAKRGPVHVTSVEDPENLLLHQTAQIDGVSMSGVLLFGGVSFAGQLRLSPMTGSRTVCESTPDSSEDPTSLVQGCDGGSETSTGGYHLAGNDVSFLGQNGKGQTVNGSCRGGSYDDAVGGTFAATELDTTCTATLAGGPTRTFTLSVIADGSSSDTSSGKGVFAAYGYRTIPLV